jgi:hypothetical protein
MESVKTKAFRFNELLGLRKSWICPQDKQDRGHPDYKYLFDFHFRS